MLVRLLANAALLLAVATGNAAVAEDQGRISENEKTAKVVTSADTAVTRNLPNEETGSSKVGLLPGRNPRVLFITMKGCSKCEQELARLSLPGGDFESMRTAGWKIGDSAESHIQIIDQETIPDLVEQLNIREFPTVACVNKGEIVRSFKAGCSTPLDVWTFGFLLKGKNERPQAAIPEPIKVATTGHYPLRGNHWSVDGDWNPSPTKLAAHLRSPNHVTQIAANWEIETWSSEELRSLHDDLHEREMGGVSAGSYAQSPPANRGIGQFAAGRKF